MLPQNNQGNSSWTLTTTGSSNRDAVQAMIEKHAAHHSNQMLVKVVKVNGGGVGIIGTVDVQPMVHQQDAQGQSQQHGIIEGVPYCRIQGGASAVIIDPVKDDIGFIVISGRDHSNVLASRKPSAPASFRLHDMSDCVYVGAFLADEPKRYIYATDKGWRIVAEEKIELEAKSIHANCDIQTDGNIKAKGDVISQSESAAISLTNHTHGGVMAGSGNTGKPQ